MIKISFWLFKKSDINQNSLEYITISNPQKVSDGNLVGMYACKVYLSDKKRMFPVYASNPIDVLHNASSFAKIYLQNIVKRGYKISEIENGERWKEAWELESGELQLILQERIKRLKEAKNISSEGKQKILDVLRDTFGKTVLKDQLS